MKIVILDGHALNPGDLSWQPLADMGELTVYDRSRPEEIVDRVGDAEIVLLNKAPLRAAHLAQCPNVRYIGVLATGYNGIPLAEARARGIPVCNAPAYSTPAVAQMTFALLLELCCHPAAHAAAVAAGEWSACPDFTFWKSPILELAGRTLGVVGFGNIGRAVARIAAAFGMRVVAWGGRETPEGRALGEYVSFDELLARSDVVSLHCPLTPETREIINSESIARMKDGAILINTARGKLVAEADLAGALRSGKLYAAATDVASREPIRPDNPLLACKNCLITPHIAWASIESRRRLMHITVDNLKSFLAGRPVNVVNLP